MIFSSVAFLFFFLPIVLTAALLLPGVRARNVFLLLASLVFYAWGEGPFVALLLVSCGLNYGFGRWLDRARASGRDRAVLGLAVAANLGLLGAFKYAGFLTKDPIHVPIGISFFTFQAITYLVDVWRRDAPLAKSPLTVSLYVSLFPQLVAGPIVRYGQVARQLVERRVDLAGFSEGVRRFAIGLGKKVLLADTLAVAADAVFALPVGDLHAGVAWLGIACFSLQIYFDFSGYSDMAIGLGRMLGFRFPENFDLPYMARSMREFWRRWHITLSTWFRDYLYVPLGGNRVSRPRVLANLVLVFLLCGLWHGANLTFVCWGLLHGAFMLLERTRFGSLLERSPRFLQHVYLVGAVVVTWSFFRAETLSQAVGFVGALAGLGSGVADAAPLRAFLTREIVVALFVGVLAATPLPGRLAARGRLWAESRPGVRILPAIASALGLAALFVLSAATVVSGSNEPFIYFRF